MGEFWEGRKSRKGGEALERECLEKRHVLTFNCASRAFHVSFTVPFKLK